MYEAYACAWAMSNESWVMLKELMRLWSHYVHGHGDFNNFSFFLFLFLLFICCKYWTPNQAKCYGISLSSWIESWTASVREFSWGAIPKKNYSIVQLNWAEKNSVMTRTMCTHDTCFVVFYTKKMNSTVWLSELWVTSNHLLLAVHWVNEWQLLLF